MSFAEDRVCILGAKMDQSDAPLDKTVSKMSLHEGDSNVAGSDCTRDATDEYNDSCDSASYAGPEQGCSTSEEQLPADLLSNSQALSAFVVNKMAQHGWSHVDPGNSLVKECSGFEGRTFKVGTIDMATSPSAVAFHVLNDQVAADPVCKGRIAAAHAAFAAHGISPSRLSQGENWFIDSWAGSKVGDVYDLNRPKAGDAGAVATASPEELGQLLARIHAIPTEWFEEWRARICSRHPALLAAEAGSHIWPFTARREVLKALPDECIRLWCEAGPKAASPAGARIVTSHSDFHPANIIRTESGLQVIDFGLSCVTCAAKDLSWACEYVLHGPEEKRPFVTAYLIASGYTAESSEVDALLLDAECFALHSFNGVLFGQLENLRADPEHGLDEYFKFAAIAQEAQTNHALQSEILQTGLFFSSRYQALL